jgi:peroxiredoxin
MFAIRCLLTCAAIGLNGAGAADLHNVPRLEIGHEVIYNGVFRQECTAGGAEFRQAYRMETRLLVLDADPKSMQIALFIRAWFKGTGSDKSDATEPCSARLETARVDLQGHVRSQNKTAFLTPLDRPATVDDFAFVPMPEGPVAEGDTWRVTDGPRPERVWRFLGSDNVDGASCYKLECLQQTDDWERPRADRAAWRRMETVWLSRRWGIVARIERVIEQREAAHRDPTRRSVTTYELQTGVIQYRAPFLTDRIREIKQAQNFAEQARRLTLRPANQNPRVFDSLLSAVTHHIESVPETPYRDAILVVRGWLDSARRGEAMPPRIDIEETETTTTAASGRTAPDFVAANVFSKTSVRLHNYVGRPVLLVFYVPIDSSETVLRFAQRLLRENEQVAVIGLALSDDVLKLHRQYEDLRLTFPIVSGKVASQSYSVDGAPYLVVIGPEGVIRSSYSGWGPETADAVEADLRRSLQPANSSQSAPTASSPNSPGNRLRP